MNAWLWPDHQIGKRESRRLREEHNKLVNSHANLVRMIERLRESIRHAHNCKAPAAYPCSCDANQLWQDSENVLAEAKAGEVGQLVKYEAKTQPGLFFWAQKIEIKGGPDAWNVVAQMTGFPASEAHDDWFANFKDADAIARQLAEEYQPMKEAK